MTRTVANEDFKSINEFKHNLLNLTINRIFHIPHVAQKP